jgi:hypothetical protein
MVPVLLLAALTANKWMMQYQIAIRISQTTVGKILRFVDISQWLGWQINHSAASQFTDTRSTNPLPASIGKVDTLFKRCIKDSLPAGDFKSQATGQYLHLITAHLMTAHRNNPLLLTGNSIPS